MRGIRASWQDPARPGQSGRKWVHNVGLGNSLVWLDYGAAWPGLCMACPGYMAWPGLGDVVAWPGLDMSGLAWVWRGLAWLWCGLAWVWCALPGYGVVWLGTHAGHEQSQNIGLRRG